jgi:hypothetical protein
VRGRGTHLQLQPLLDVPQLLCQLRGAVVQPNVLLLELADAALAVGDFLVGRGQAAVEGRHRAALLRGLVGLGLECGVDTERERERESE